MSNIDRYIQKAVKRELARRRYSDSKTRIGRKRYIDAVRKYRDAEERAEASRLAVLVEKINAKISQFKNEHPSMAKLSRILLKISSCLDAMRAGGSAAYLVARLTPLCKEARETLKAGEDFLGLKHAPIINGVNIVISSILSFVKWTLARKLESDGNAESRDEVRR